MRVLIIGKLLFALAILFLASSCVTTSTYGANFVPSEDASVYTLKIHYDDPPLQMADDVAFQQGTDSRLYKEAMAFMEANPQYQSYEVLKITHNLIPPYYKYTVKFGK